MGKISYRPGKGQNRQVKKEHQADRQMEVKPAQQQEQEITMQENGYEGNEHEKENEVQCEETEKVKVSPEGSENTGKRSEIKSTRVVGEMGNDYHIYIEDYVYTYLYQFAASDYTKESSAALVGQSYSDSKEILVKGIIPVNMDKLSKDAEWIDMGVMEEIEQVRKNCFKDQQIIGWMHMQPGYGTMLTMKELKEHQNVFEGNGTVCMLVDAINKIETLFVYEEGELKEQPGYCMYYERNEQMQQYMLEHPFNTAAKEEMKDQVVSQFREIGKMRKAEYMQRKNLNLTVMIASIVLIALTAVIVKMNDSRVKNNAQPVSMQLSADQQDRDPLEDLKDETDLVQADEEADREESLQNDQADSDEKKTEDETNKNEEVTDGKILDSQEITEEAGEYDTYIVQKGDTLADICYKEYGSAQRSAEVAKFNGLSNTDALYVGQKLKMPK